MNSYDKATKIINENRELVDDFGGVDLNIITKAEKTLGVNFPKDYTKFIQTYGSLTFGSQEIYGVFTEDFSNSGIPDAVWLTMEERGNFNLPTCLVIIYDTGMGELFCLNYRELNNKNEPKVTSYFEGFKKEVQENKILYDSFSDFLLDIVKQELS